MDLSNDIVGNVLGAVIGVLAIALGFSIKKLLNYEGLMSVFSTDIKNLKDDTMNLMKSQKENVQSYGLIQNMVTTVDTNMCNFKETIERVLNNFDKFSDSMIELSRKLDIHVAKDDKDGERLHEMQSTINKLLDSQNNLLKTVNHQNARISRIESKLKIENEYND